MFFIYVIFWTLRVNRRARLLAQLVDLLGAWLGCLLVDWLLDWLVDWLVGWFADWLGSWLVACGDPTRSPLCEKMSVAIPFGPP